MVKLVAINPNELRINKEKEMDNVLVDPDDNVNLPDFLNDVPIRSALEEDTFVDNSWNSSSTSATSSTSPKAAQGAPNAKRRRLASLELANRGRNEFLVNYKID